MTDVTTQDNKQIKPSRKRLFLVGGVFLCLSILCGGVITWSTFGQNDLPDIPLQDIFGGDRSLVATGTVLLSVDGAIDGVDDSDADGDMLGLFQNTLVATLNQNATSEAYFAGNGTPPGDGSYKGNGPIYCHDEEHPITRQEFVYEYMDVYENKPIYEERSTFSTARITLCAVCEKEITGEVSAHASNTGHSGTKVDIVAKETGKERVEIGQESIVIGTKNVLVGTRTVVVCDKQKAIGYR